MAHDTKELIASVKLPFWTENPVLIYGPRKGGTTLVQNLMDGGNHMLVFPSEVKLKIFANELFYDKASATKTYFSHSMIVNQKFESFDDKKYLICSKELETTPLHNLADLLKHDIHNIYQCTEEKPSDVFCWAMKEVGGQTTQIIKMFRRLFFSGKVVMIIRDPQKVTRSVILDRRRKGIKLGLKQLIKQTVDPLRVLDMQKMFIKKPGIYTICYEDLVEENSLKKVMGGICSFLSIPYSDVFENPSIFNNEVVVKTSSQNTKRVFRNNTKWHELLTFREKTVVYITKLLFLLKYYVKHKQYLPSYQKVRDDVSKGYVS